MADHAIAKNALTAAVNKRWSDIPDGLWAVCKKTRKGLLADRGSENIGAMAWGAAFIISKLMPRLLPAWMRRNEPEEWWDREMRDRMRHGLMLAEEDSRIYFGWHWAPIAAVWALAVGELRRLCRDWMRAQTAKMALCAVPVKPKRYEPAINAKLDGNPLFVPPCGARSWSADDEDGKPGREAAHHMGSSAWESVAGAMIFDRWKPKQPAHQWELDVMTAAGRPELFTGAERAALRRAVNNPEDLSPVELSDLAAMAGLGNAKWPCFLVRFRDGGACVRYGRGSGVSTAPLYTMAIHRDGTIHFLALDSGARQGHNINYEPCGMEIQDGRVMAWAGGEDLPKTNLHFDAARWKDILWVVDIGTRGSEVVWPEPEKPPVPGPGPGPTPPAPPRRRSDWVKYRYLAIALALAGLLIWWQGC